MAALAITVLVASAVLEVAFVFCYTTQTLVKNNVWLPLDMRLLAQILYICGVVADVIFNQVRGRIIFRELSSHGLMFSNRVQWHIDNSNGKPLETARAWARLLNSVAPGHIKNV